MSVCVSLMFQIVAVFFQFFMSNYAAVIDLLVCMWMVCEIWCDLLDFVYLFDIVAIEENGI